MMRKILSALFVLGSLIFALQVVNAEGLNATVCCEKTISGAFCQNAPSNQCDSAYRQVPTSCDSTSYCKMGTCYDSSEGTCLDNTPQLVCNANGGVWSATSPAQCSLGCCVLGDQAAFVSLVRCKKLSSSLGLSTNFDNSIKTEIACVATVQAQDKGACVYEFEFQKTCKFTTRAECAASTRSLNGTSSSGNFFKDKLCSAEELGTNCGPSQKTACVPGKDEVYFLDTCGNPANIYDSTKLKDKEYWTNVKTKDQSCNPLLGNTESPSCGNCNYLSGSYCRDSKTAGARATYGDNICADLNCVDENGKSRKHGESWCISDDKKTGLGTNTVGSRFFRRICMNGQTVTEPCSDFRNEECVQSNIDTIAGPFSQSACRINRWQDCLAQSRQRDCENTDRRDCFWKEGFTLGQNDTNGGVCLPKNSPGLDFWGDEQTRAICGQGNKVCVVSFEKGLFGGEKCTKNCDCLGANWEKGYGDVCSSLGDCGIKVNYVGIKGFNEGVNKTIVKS